MKQYSKWTMGIVLGIASTGVFAFSASAQLSGMIKVGFAAPPLRNYHGTPCGKRTPLAFEQPLNLRIKDREGWGFVEVVEISQEGWGCLDKATRRKDVWSRAAARPLFENGCSTSSVRRAPVPIPGSNYATKRNPGGLRSSRGAFEYETVEDGVRAMDTLLGKNYFPNPAYNTINKYVDEYAGQIGKNKIEEYKCNISRWSGVPRDKVIDVNDRGTRNALLAAALRQESGGDWREYVEGLFGKNQILDARRASWFQTGVTVFSKPAYSERGTTSTIRKQWQVVDR